MASDLAASVRALEAIGHAARYFPTTGSTNDDARAWAAAGAPSGAIVLADEQTAGRGRHGRTWSAPVGASLALSIVTRPDVAPSRLAPLAIVAGLAVREAIAPRLAHRRVRVKWPNDVVVGEKKIAGVLVEASLSGRAVDHAIVGIGVNVNRSSFPEEIAHRATSLSLEGARDPDLDRTAIALDVVRAFDRALVEWLADPEALGARLAPHDALRDVAVQLEDGRRGVAVGLEGDGRLRVRLDDGALVLALAGEVVPVPRARRDAASPNDHGDG